MKKKCLAIALSVVIMQISQLSAGEKDVSLRSSSESLNTENSMRYGGFYQGYGFDKYYQNDQPVCYYDGNQNYVMIYSDGTYSVYYYFSSICVTYYLDGSIRCDYNNRSFAMYDPNVDLSQYFSNSGYPTIATPGLPNGVPSVYQVELPQYNYDSSSNKNKRKYKKPNNNKRTRLNDTEKSQEQLIFFEEEREQPSIDTKSSGSSISFADALKRPAKSFEQTSLDENMVEEKFEQPSIGTKSSSFSISFADILKRPAQSFEQKSIDENMVEEDVKPIKTSWSTIAKKLSDSDFAESKPITIKKHLFNYVGLDNDAKLFLDGIGVENYTEIKLKIKSLIHISNFLTFVNAANDFRHSSNIQNNLLSNNILELILLNKNIKKYSLLQSRVYQYLGKIRSHDNKHQEAINIFEKGLRYCENNARLYYFMGNDYAALERYDEAIKNWEKAFRYVYVDDIEIKIKALNRLLYCEHYHQKNDKTIKKLYFNIVDLIQNNNLINEYKDLYIKLIMDFTDYKEANNCAVIFTYEQSRSKGPISQNMLDMVGNIYEKHKEYRFS